MKKQSTQLMDLAQEMVGQLSGMRFADPVATTYNPLDYAWKAHRQFLSKYGNGECRVLMMGMNPGP